MTRQESLRWVLFGSLLAWSSACARASEDELLSGKTCSDDDDCVGGFFCDSAVLVCVRGSGDASASAGSGGTTAGSAGASAGGGESGEGGAGSSSNAGSAGSESSAGAGGISGSGGAPGRGEEDCDASCRSCIDGACIAAWSPMSAAPSGFAARAQAAYAAGGGKLLIWGGADAEGVGLDSGAIYDPAEDSWELTTVNEDTPSPRVLANAAWTGSRFMIWGGRSSSGSADYKDGALYDPVTRVWTPVKNAGAARAGALTLGSAGQVLAWGGWTKNGGMAPNAERYTVASNAWSSSGGNQPAKREHVGWTIGADGLYVLGGRSDSGEALSDAFVYHLSSGGWSSLPSLPEARYGSFVVHDGATLWLWGGRDEIDTMSDGLALNASEWTATALAGAPAARWAPQRQSGWSCNFGSGFFGIVGGHDEAGKPLLDGGVYDASEGTWRPIPPAQSAHEWGAGACIGGEVLLWGGSNDGVMTASGERWAR